MLAQIHNLYPSMTKAEKRIADVIIGDPFSIARMQSKQLADKAGTASSAVTRFCRTLGVEGFSDLKILLAEEGAKTSAKETATKFNPNNSASEIFTNVFNSGIRTLKDTLENIDFKLIDEIAERLISANRIFSFGVSTSGIIAANANNRFTQMGLNSVCCTDYMLLNTTATNLKPGDVALAISSSGTTKVVVDAARLARESGATTIAITSFSESLLAKECDYKIVAYSDDQNYPIESVSARVAHLCITDALMLMLISKSGDALSNRMAKEDKRFKEFYYN